MDKYREEAKDLARSEEDVLSYALFPQVAAKFLAERNKKLDHPEGDPDEVRTIIVQDLSE